MNTSNALNTRVSVVSMTRAVTTAADLAGQLANARAALARITALTDDPAVARLAGGPLRIHRRRVETHARRTVEALERIASLEHRLALAEHREAEASRERLAADQVHGARFVRTRHGWHEVVRVNATSVTVRTEWSWDERIALGKVLEVRR